MANFLTRYPIAIDLSDGAEMSALQLGASRGGSLVRAARRREVGAGEGNTPGDEAVMAFTRDVLRCGAFRGKAVALLPPAEVLRTYPLRVEIGKNESLDSAVVRHAAGDLNLSTEEWILDYASTGPEGAAAGGKRVVLLVASRREDVSRYLGLVARAGGVLEVLDSEASVLVRAHSLSAASPNPVLLCNIGRLRTALVVATGDAILAHRNVAWGTEGLSRKLVDNLGLGGQSRDADFLLRKHGVLHATAAGAFTGLPDEAGDAARTVGQLLAPVVDELVQEFHNLAGYVRSGSPDVVLDGLFLYGRGARVGGLAEYIAREMNVEARAVNPLEKVGLRDAPALVNPADGAAYTLALGLAMRRVRWL